MAGLFTPNAQLSPGSLISFRYPQSWAYPPNVIHDPKPMVIVSRVTPRYLFGVNLHYLTFPYIKRLLANYAGKNFIYQYHVKPDVYMALAFRRYTRQGIQQIRTLDTDWLITLLQSVRSFDAGELEKIRSNIEKQIQSRLQIKANELNMYEATNAGNQGLQTVQMNVGANNPNPQFVNPNPNQPQQPTTLDFQQPPGA